MIYFQEKEVDFDESYGMSLLMEIFFATKKIKFYRDVKHI